MEVRGEARAMFAAILLVIAGVLNVIYGIAAISNADFFNHQTAYVIFGLGFWGWVTLIIGLVQLTGGYSLFSGGVYGRTVGIVAATLGRDRVPALGRRQLPLLVAGHLRPLPDRPPRPGRLRRAGGAALARARASPAQRLTRAGSGGAVRSDSTRPRRLVRMYVVPAFRARSPRSRGRRGRRGTSRSRASVPPAVRIAASVAADPGADPRRRSSEVLDVSGRRSPLDLAVAGPASRPGDLGPPRRPNSSRPSPADLLGEGPGGPP